MTIARDFLGGDGTLPILFHISETIDVWDGHVALVVDHLLNHVKVLSSLAEGPADQSIIDILSKHPHYRLERKSYLTKEMREAAAEILIDECLVLLEALSIIAPVMDIEREQQNRCLQIVQQEIPFHDYRYLGDPHISDAKRED